MMFWSIQTGLPPTLTQPTAYPEAAFFGGTIVPHFDSTPPGWVKHNVDRIEGPLCTRGYSDGTRLLKNDEYPVGANMAFRRSAIEGRYFDVNVGHRAGRLFGGDETKYVDELRADGLHGVWVGDAIVHDIIPPEKMTREFLSRWCDPPRRGHCGGTHRVWEP